MIVLAVGCHPDDLEISCGGTLRKYVEQGADDRLIGASLLAREQGISPVYTALGAAGAVYRYLAENGQEQTVDNARAVLAEISGLQEDDSLCAMIVEMYGWYQNGDSPATMCWAVQKCKTQMLEPVV